MLWIIPFKETDLEEGGVPGTFKFQALGKKRVGFNGKKLFGADKGL